MKSYFSLFSILFLLLLPQGLAGYTELMKAARLNTGQPKWERLASGSNPASGENTTLNLFLDLNSIQNITTPWISYRTMEVYEPYSSTVTFGKKVSTVTSTQLANCQTKTEIPLQLIVIGLDKNTIFQKVFTEPSPRTSAPNAPSSHILKLICDIAYTEKPQAQFSQNIATEDETKNGPNWIAFAESKKPDKIVTLYYDKKSLIRKGDNSLSYTIRETFNPFTVGLYGTNQITSRITHKITNCRNKQDAIISRSYFGTNGKPIHTDPTNNIVFQQNNPRSIEEAVRHEVCLYIDSVPSISK